MNKVEGDGWGCGDGCGLFKFAEENGAFVGEGQEGFCGVNEEEGKDMGDLGMRGKVGVCEGGEG